MNYSKAIVLFLLFLTAFSGLAQIQRNEKTDKPQTTPINDPPNLPEVLARVELKYPSEAMRAKFSGTFKVRVLVNEKGEVYEARARSGPPLLIQPALDAAVQWKFKPMLVNGEPKPFFTTLILKYHY